MLKKRLLALVLATTVATSSLTVYANENVTKDDVTAYIKESRISYERDSKTGYISVNEDVQTPKPIYNNRVSADKVLPSAYQGYSDVVSKYPATRNQNPYGTCWAFASVGTGEFDLVNQGAYTKSNIDLSELQLAYNMYHTGNDKMGNLDGDKNELASDATYHYLDIGGNVYFAQHVLANWRGLVSESTLPYSKAASTLTTALGTSYSYKNDAAKLVNTRVISTDNDVTSVKQAIYDHGAVYGSYYHDSNYYSENGGNALYYHSGNPGATNHAITIVGWDDNFARTNWASSNRPASNGAWLIRNSWDTSSDESEYCYFWMSYEDTSLADAVYMLDYEPGSAYDNIYQHDGSASHVSINSYQVANVFTAKSPDGSASETLDAVMVSMTQDVDAKIKVEVYTDLTSSSNPQSGVLQSNATTTATTAHQGIYTIKLNNPVQLAPGQKYSIVITSTSGNKYIDLEDTYTYSGWVSMTAGIDSGESFWKSSSSSGWYDLADMGSGYGNICVKGLTKNSDSEVHNHAYGEWIVDTEATCTTAGSKHKECSVCGDIVTEELPALGHDWNTEYTIDKPATCKEDGSKSIHCKNCDETKDITVIPKGEHVYSEWTIIKSPTCTETGIRHATCTLCGTAVEESVPALGHTEVVDKGYSATCTTTGLTDGSHCSVCNEVIIEQTVIPVAEHDWNSSYTIDKPATCKEEGSKSIHCKNCSATKNSKVIPLTDHSYGGWVVVEEANCTEKGSKYKKCSVCNDVIVASIPATGHSYDEGVADPKATTSADGMKTYTCTNGCGDTITEVISKISSQKLSYTKTVYSGSAKKPTVTVKDADGNELTEGTDYDVTYASGRTKVGRYKVTITYKGDYEGSKSIYFTIVPKAPSSASANLSSASQTKGYDDIKFTWKASTGATGYLVYYKKASASTWSGPVDTTNTAYTKKDLTDGIKYTFKVIPYYKTSTGTTKYYSTAQNKTASVYTLKKISTPTVSTNGTKVKVKWVNISGESGYQISKSTSKTGTNVVSTYSTTSGTYKNLSATKGKTYYYKVRAYKTVDGKKIYAPWSNVKEYIR